MILFFVAMCLWQSATSFATPQPNKSQKGAITEISSERTIGLMNEIRTDKVLLRADGTAIYVGKSDVERIGRFQGVISKPIFDQLAQLLLSQKFFDLKTHAVVRPDEKVSIFAAVRGGKRKMIYQYGSSYSTALWGIEMAIRGVAADIKWKKVESKSDAEKTKSNLRGVAMAGPISPVEREGELNEKPLAGAVITIQPDGGGKEIIRRRADKEGRFEFALEPGTYLLVPLGPQASDTASEESEPDDKPKKKWMLPSGEPQTIVIADGKVTEVVVHYDTGIR